MAGNGGSARGSEVIMFTGKGGVGKTTCAAATALHHAAGGKRTLAISTDGMPSLSHIFEVTGNGKPVDASGLLHINELGEREIREMWDRKFGAEMYEVFSSFVSIDYARFVEFMTSVLPGLGDEFMVDYIREMALQGGHDVIVWDTAPLGQTLALLKTPALLSQHLRMAPRIYSRLKVGKQSREPVLDILRRWESLSAENMDFLRDGVRFTLVTIPEALAVAQLEGIFREMDAFGLRVRRIVINNVVRADGSEFLRQRAAQQEAYLEDIHRRYAHLDITEVPMFPIEVKGAERLRGVERMLY